MDKYAGSVPTTQNERLTLARTRLGLTQREMGVFFGVHYTTLGQWEDSATIDPIYFRAMDSVGVSFDWLERGGESWLKPGCTVEMVRKAILKP